MAKLPDGLNDQLPTPNPQRTVQGYDSQSLPNAQMQAGAAMREDALAIQQKQDKDAILDAQSRSNMAKQRVINLLYGDGQNEGLYAAKGGAAIGVGDKYSKSYAEIRAQALNGVENPVAQRALARDLEDLNLSNLDNVKRFEMTERKGYTSDLTQAQQSLDSTRAGLEYNNQKTVDTLLASADKTGQTSAKLKGAVPGDLIWQQEITKARGAVLSSQLDAMSKSKDPATLMQFENKYEEYRKAGNLPLSDVEKFDKIRETISPTIEALKARQDDNHQQMTYQAPDDKVLEAIHAARVQDESGGKQFGGPGSVAGPNEPTTSPKGAIGISQIMPATGPDAAKLAGVPWDENKFKNDASYNKKLGDAYYLQQKKDFGDTRMALMAYNAGPTVVRDWMNGTNDSKKNPDKLKIGDPSKSQVSVDQFIAQVPFAETRAYPGKVLKSAGYTGSIGPMDMTVAQEKAALMTPDGGKTYLEMVKRDNQAYAAQTDQFQKQTMDEVIQYMQDQNAGYHLLPPDLPLKIQQAGLTDQVRNYNPKAASDPSTLAYLMDLPPKKLLETDLNTPDIRFSLSPTDYTKWKQKQSQMTTPAAQVTESFMQKVLKDGFTKRGVSVQTHYDPDTGEAITDGGPDFLRAHDLLNAYVDSYSQRNNGRLPDGAEIQKMGDQIFTKLIVTTPGKLWGLFGPNTEEYNKYGIKLVDDGKGGTVIPADEQKILVDRLLRRGESPTEQAIINSYIMTKGM